MFRVVIIIITIILFFVIAMLHQSSSSSYVVRCFRLLVWENLYLIQCHTCNEPKWSQTERVRPFPLLLIQITGDKKCVFLYTWLSYMSYICAQWVQCGYASYCVYLSSLAITIKHNIMKDELILITKKELTLAPVPFFHQSVIILF